MEQEVKPLLEKGAIEYVPHSNRETRLYSRYFIFPKKDGGMRPILDLRVLNDSVMAAQVQNVNFETNRATDQIRGLVCHDRSQGRILPHIHPSISQEVPEVHSWGQSIPISGSSVLPRIINLHFHEMRRCPRGATPFHIIKVTRRRLHALIMWKKPWFLSQGPMLGASCRRKMLTTDASLMGLGSDLRGTLKSGSVEEPSSLMAHQPYGDVSCISCLRIS